MEKLKFASLRLLFLMLFLPLFAFATNKEIVYAEPVCNKSVVYLGDSCVVTYQFFSSLPFYQIEESKTHLKIKGCSVRKINYYGRPSQQQVVKDNKVLYLINYEQYVVTPLKNGLYELPELAFNVSLQESQSSGDPFADFFGMGRQPKITKHTIKSKTLKIKVEDKPRKTTSEMLGTGGTVL